MPISAIDAPEYDHPPGRVAKVRAKEAFFLPLCRSSARLKRKDVDQVLVLDLSSGSGTAPVVTPTRLPPLLGVNQSQRPCTAMVFLRPVIIVVVVIPAGLCRSGNVSIRRYLIRGLVFSLSSAHVTFSDLAPAPYGQRRSPTPLLSMLWSGV